MEKVRQLIEVERLAAAKHRAFGTVASKNERDETRCALDDYLTKHGWIPIEKVPDEGVFQVFLEEELLGSRVHTMNKHKNITSIASGFAFDAPRVLFYRLLPEPPEGFE